MLNINAEIILSLLSICEVIWLKNSRASPLVLEETLLSRIACVETSQNKRNDDTFAQILYIYFFQLYLHLSL